MATFYYQITSVSLSQFATLADEFDPQGGYQLNSEIRFGFNASRNELTCTFSLVCQENGGAPVLKAEMICGFHIQEKSLAGLKKMDDIIFPVDFLGHLASLTYSSLRGAIHVKAEGTSFCRFVLPLQDVSAYITKPYIYHPEEGDQGPC